MNKYLTIAGMFTASALLSFSVFFYALTPVFILALAGVVAISPKTRPFAWGLYATALSSFVFFIAFLIAQNTAPPGTIDYGPSYRGGASYQPPVSPPGQTPGRYLTA